MKKLAAVFVFAGIMMLVVNCTKKEDVVQKIEKPVVEEVQVVADSVEAVVDSAAVTLEEEIPAELDK